VKNKGYVIIFVLLFEYFLVMVCESLDLTTTGGTLLTIPSDPWFIDMVLTSFKIFIGLLTFSIVGIPDILVLFAVYLPLLLAFVSLFMIVKGD